jgi:hypothetical protein
MTLIVDYGNMLKHKESVRLVGHSVALNACHSNSSFVDLPFKYRIRVCLLFLPEKEYVPYRFIFMISL